MDNILVITDSSDMIMNKGIFNFKRNNQYHLHTINTNVEGVLNNIYSDQNYKNYKISIIETYKINQIADRETREYYVRWVRDFPGKKLFNGKSLNEILSRNKRNYWWYLPISEKNIWTSRYVHRLYEIIRLSHILNREKYDKICFIISDKILKDTFVEIAKNNKIFIINNPTYNWENNIYVSLLLFIITYYVNVTKAFIGAFIKKIILTFYKTPVSSNDLGQIGIFSMFPLFWENLDSAKPTNIFFKELPYKIAEKYVIKHLVWLSSWKVLLKNRKCFGKFLNNDNTYILDNNLRLKDALTLYNIDFIFELFLILASRNKVDAGSFNGIRIDQLIYDELTRSFSSPAFFQAVLIDLAFQKLNLDSLKILLFRLEFQPHERSILYNTHGGDIQTIGFQHSALSKNFLNYVFMDGELEMYLNNKSKNTYKSMPLPDYIFTSGKVGSNFMSDAGYPLNKITIVGGIRFSEIYNYKKTLTTKDELRVKYGLPLDKKIIFCPTSLFLDETINMLNSLIFSTKDEQSTYYLIIKLHPACDKKMFSNKIERYLTTNCVKNSNFYISQSINNYDYITLSDISIYLGGSMAIEAMLLGESPLVYLSRCNFTHNPIADYLDSVHVAFDRKSMKERINTLNMTNTGNNMQVVTDMFSGLDDKPYDKFINEIDKIYNGVNK